MGIKRGRGIIVGRKCPRSQTCPTCGRLRVLHDGGVYSCPVPPTVTAALRTFRVGAGVRWKAKLRDAWTRGDDLGQELQQARNLIGPTRLGKITL